MIFLLSDEHPAMAVSKRAYSYVSGLRSRGATIDSIVADRASFILTLVELAKYGMIAAHEADYIINSIDEVEEVELDARRQKRNWYIQLYVRTAKKRYRVSSYRVGLDGAVIAACATGDEHSVRGVYTGTGFRHTFRRDDARRIPVSILMGDVDDIASFTEECSKRYARLFKKSSFDIDPALFYLGSALYDIVHSPHIVETSIDVMLFYACDRIEELLSSERYVVEHSTMSRIRYARFPPVRTSIVPRDARVFVARCGLESRVADIVTSLVSRGVPYGKIKMIDL